MYAHAGLLWQWSIHRLLRLEVIPFFFPKDTDLPLTAFLVRSFSTGEAQMLFFILAAVYFVMMFVGHLLQDRQLDMLLVLKARGQGHQL